MKGFASKTDVFYVITFFKQTYMKSKNLRRTHCEKCYITTSLLFSKTHFRSLISLPHCHGSPASLYLILYTIILCRTIPIWFLVDCKIGWVIVFITCIDCLLVRETSTNLISTITPTLVFIKVKICLRGLWVM